MAAKKNDFPSWRVRLDGYIQMADEGITKNPRDQVLYDFMIENGPGRNAYPMAKELLIAALLGELGPKVQKAVKAGDTEEAHAALDDLLSEFMT